MKVDFGLISEKMASMIDFEAKREKMLPKSATEIRDALECGEACVTLADGKPVSYVGYTEWGNSLEIGSLITDPDYRKQGYGKVVVMEMIKRLQGKSSKPIMAMANPDSCGIFQKLGFRIKPLTSIDGDVRDACKSCLENIKWPNCHCRYLVLEGKVITSKGTDISVIPMGINGSADFQQFSELYCKIWAEEPWNESWTCKEVEELYGSAIGGESLAYQAIVNGKIAGFTIAKPITNSELAARTNGELDQMVSEDMKKLYIAEVAVDSAMRGKGTAGVLTQYLADKAKEYGFGWITLRTDIDAIPARALYSQLGFKDTGIVDAEHSDRTYWVL